MEPQGVIERWEDLHFEETGCLLCGSRHSSLLLETADPHDSRINARYAVVRCHDCGLCYTNPRPTPQSILRCYQAEYAPHQAADDSAARRRRRTQWSQWTAMLRGRRQIAWHGQGRLLDFGCGSGSFLRRMHDEGWQVVGIDSSPAVVERIRTQMGLRALAGSLPHPELAAGSFDVITMWQVLEHVHRPLEVLGEARRLLAEGGRLVISVPDIDSRPFRWFGPDWFGLDLPRHLTHFSTATLRRMVEQAGFRVDRTRPVAHASWLQASARRAVQRGRSTLLPRLLQIRATCRLAAWYCVLTGSADAVMLTATRDDSSGSEVT